MALLRLKHTIKNTFKIQKAIIECVFFFTIIHYFNDDYENVALKMITQKSK